LSQLVLSVATLLQWPVNELVRKTGLCSGESHYLSFNITEKDETKNLRQGQA